MNDPLWKTVLHWGAVITFLTFPLVILSIQIYANTHPGWWTWNDELTPEQQHQRYQYLSEFMRNVTILVFGLAGLRTWETIKNGNHNNERKTT
jgi:hypothetical protein